MLKKETNKMEKAKEQQKFYGKHNFIIPDLTTIKRAMGYDSLTPKEQNLLLPLNKTDNEGYFHTLLYKPVKIPKPNEWLYEHKESGQTFKAYSGGMINQPSKSFNKIYLNILDNENDILTTDDIDIVVLFINSYFPGLKCELMKKHYSFDDLKVPSRMNYYHQYNGGEAINKLKSVLPKDGLLIVGLSVKDIYPRDEWNFCYGLADKMQGAGVFSFIRHYDDIEKEFPNTKERKVQALYKTAFTFIHEIGHLLGLKHCVYYDCIIRGCNHSGEVFNKFYCPVCMRKLYWNLKLDIVKYWEGILELYEKLNIKYPGSVDEQLLWVKERLKLL